MDIHQKSANNKLIIKNSLALYMRMFLVMAVGLYTSRIILRALGIEDFGIFNVVSGFVSVFTFISGAMIAATERFLNFHIGADSEEQIQKVFNASQIIHIAAAVIIIFLAETLGLWFLYNKMIIPENKLSSAFWVFQFSVFTTALLFVSFPYNAVIIARERMKIFAYISIMEAALKLAVVYCLSFFAYDHLILYGFLIFLVQIVITLTYRIYCRINFAETKFKIRNIDRALYLQLLSFSGWNLFGNIASVALNQGTNILLNLFFGPFVNAAKGISLQVQNAVYSVFGNFQMAQNPQIIKSYALGDYHYFHQLIFRSSKFSYYLVFVMLLPLFVNSQEILKFWLGSSLPEYTTVFVNYTLFYSLITSLAMPLITGSQATGNIKKIMTTIAVFFWMIIPVGYIILKMGYGPIALFKVQALFYIIAHLLRVYIVSGQLGFSKKEYCTEVLFPIFLVTGISGFLAWLLYYFVPFLSYKGIGWLILSCVVFALLGALFVFALGMKKSERVFVYNMIQKYI